MRKDNRPVHILPQELSDRVKNRFHKYAQKSDSCWLWRGTITTHGYGQTGLSWKPMRCILAHRLAWLILKGEIPEGLLVLHHCDNPICVNPDHLFLGTNKDNVDDMWRKNRANVECAHKAATKLNTEKARDIQRMYATGHYTQKRIAELFGCSKITICSIVNRIPLYSR